MIVPLKREFMREDSRSIIFKYDSEVTVFGQITRINMPDAKPNRQDGFSALNNIFNNIWPEMLERLGLLKDKNDYIVISPMAVYFE